MESLQAELIMEILSRVPTLDLVKLSSVCRRWRNIILNDPVFRRFHRTRVMSKPVENQVLLLKRGSKLYWVDLTNKTSPRQVAINLPYIPNFSDYQFVGSCSGLLCLASWECFKILVMNPFTRHHVLIPMPREFRTDFFVSLGFGFDEVTKSFKMVMVGGAEFKVYDLGSPNSINWRSLGVITIPGICMGYACFFKGRLHWTCWTGGPLNIISFDLADEEFKPIPTPDCPLPTLDFKAHYYDLVVLGGCLCLFQVETLTQPKLLIWAMKEYGIKTSWVMEFNIYLSMSNSDARSVHVLGFGKDSELVVSEFDSRSQVGTIFISSDSTYDELKRLQLEKQPRWNGSIIHTAALNWI